MHHAVYVSHGHTLLTTDTRQGVQTSVGRRRVKSSMSTRAMHLAVAALTLVVVGASAQCVTDYSAAINYFPAESQLRSGAEGGPNVDAHVSSPPPLHPSQCHWAMRSSSQSTRPAPWRARSNPAQLETSGEMPVSSLELG